MSASLLKTRNVSRRGTRANQPAATNLPEGSVYNVTDELLIERTTGAAWQTFGASFETGTWTPSLTFATPGDLALGAYTNRVGAYIRIGPLVLVWFNVIVTPTFTTSAGNLQLTGLPYTAGNVSARIGLGALQFTNLTLAAGYQMSSARVGPNENFVTFTKSGTGVANVSVQAGDVTSAASTQLASTVAYLVST